MDTAEQWEEKGTVLVDFDALFCRLLERWKFIVCLALIGALLAAFFCICIATPHYEATSKIYINTRSDSVINISDIQLGSYLTRDYEELFMNWEALDKVINNLGLRYSRQQLSQMVKFTNPNDTRLLYITVNSTDPVEAKNIANEFATVGAEFIAQIMKVETPSTVSTALVPEAPVSPKTKLMIALGLICGVLAAVVIIIVQFLKDDKIKTASDLQKLNITTLVVVPTNSADRTRGRAARTY